MLSRVLLRRPPLRIPTRGRNVSLSGHNKPYNMLRVPTRGAQLASHRASMPARRWTSGMRHPPGPRVDEKRSLADLIGGAPNPCPPQAALEALRASIACERSARTGERVEVGTITSE